MPSEIKREIVNGVLRISFDDGSVKIFPLETPPQDIVAERDFNPTIVSRHVFKDQQ